MENRHSVLRPARQAVEAVSEPENTGNDNSVLVPRQTVNAYRIVNAIRRANELEPDTPSRPRSWEAGGVGLVIFFLAAGVTFGFICVHAFRSVQNATPVQSATSHDRSGPLHEALGLHIEPTGRRLLITWNQDAAAVRNALAGQLRIDDGTRHQTVTLDEHQIHNGAISYRAWTGDINVELTFSDESGKARMESYRILDDALGRPASSSPTPPAPKEDAHAIGELAAVEREKAIRQTTGNIAPALPSSPSLSSANGSIAPATGRTEPEKVAESPAAAGTGDQAPGTMDAKIGEKKEDGSGMPPAQTAMAQAPVANSLTAVSGTAPPFVAAPASASQEEQRSPQPVKQSTKESTLTPSAAVPTAPATVAKPLTMVNPSANSLRSARIFKTCELRIYADIDETGRVIAARPLVVDRAIGPEMVVASIAAARQWKFAPARSSSGLPVKSHYSIVFRFQPSH